MADINLFRYRGYYQDDETGFYYLQTRYYDPEIKRFINADNYELLGQLSLSLGQLNMYSYCNNNPVMYTDPNGDFPILISLAIIFGIGALSGVAGTFIGDMTNAIFTGQWTWSSWETYVGSAVGYGTGAIATLFLGASAGLAIGSGLSAFSGMSLEKVTGTNNRSWLEIGGSTLGSAAFGAVMGHFTKGWRLQYITKGSGSFQHVMNTQFTNMVRHGYNISIGTAVKSFYALTVSRHVIGNVGKGLYRAGQQWWMYFIYGDSSGLGWN